MQRDRRFFEVRLGGRETSPAKKYKNENVEQTKPHPLSTASPAERTRLRDAEAPQQKPSEAKVKGGDRGKGMSTSAKRPCAANEVLQPNDILRPNDTNDYKINDYHETRLLRLEITAGNGLFDRPRFSICDRRGRRAAHAAARTARAARMDRPQAARRQGRNARAGIPRHGGRLGGAGADAQTALRRPRRARSSFRATTATGSSRSCSRRGTAARRRGVDGHPCIRMTVD